MRALESRDIEVAEERAVASRYFPRVPEMPDVTLVREVRDRAQAARARGKAVKDDQVVLDVLQYLRADDDVVLEL